MTTAAVPANALNALATRFRTCPATGLNVDLAAERLIKANAVAAVVFLAIGGTFGLLVALTRWPAVHLLSSDMFYLVLTAHGLDVLLLWIIFFEMAVLYFASAVILSSRIAAPRWGWVGFALMVVGGLMTNVAVLQGDFERDVHLLRANASTTTFLSRAHPLCRGGTHWLLHLPGHPGDCQGGENL